MTGWRPLGEATPRAPRHIGETIDPTLRRVGGESAVTFTAVLRIWAEIVGDDVARHAVPVGLEREVLVLRVDDPAWATQLRLLASEITERLRAVPHLECIKVLEVRPGGGPRGGG